MALERLTRRQNPLEEDLMNNLGPGQTSPGAGDLGEELLAGLPQTSSDRFRNRQDLTQEQRIPFQLPPREQLRADVGRRIGEAQQAFEQGAQERGAFTEGQAERIRQRGINIGGQVVAQSEFNELLDAENNAIQELTRTAGIRDNVLAEKFQGDIKNKLSKARTEILKRGLELKKQLQEQKASAAKKRAIANAFGQIAGAAIGGFIAGPAGAAGGAAVGGAATGGGNQRS